MGARVNLNPLMLTDGEELQLTPTRKWPGKGLLGVTIRFDSFEGAEDQLLHVLVRGDTVS